MSQWWEQKEESFTTWTELQTSDGLTYFFNTETGETSWERPEELLTEDDVSRQGEWVWMPDEKECFIPAKVLNRGATISLETDEGQHFEVNASEELEPLKWSSLQRVTPDLVLLDNMSDPLILHNLRKRFEDGKIYTNIGTILISINPYTDLKMYGLEKIEEYRVKLADHKDMPPHVFIIGDNAFKGLTFASGLNQSVIISGESGAGKTEAAKQVVTYLAAVAGSVSGIENKLFVSNPVLESFGNAKTVRNNNSSRFGKYMEIYFNKDYKICAAHITNYLLEKIRVPSQAAEERNYHIFYQLCKGGGALAEQFNLGDPSYFHYLNQSGCMDVFGIDDQADFQETNDAMDQLGFSGQEKNDVFGLVAGVLHCGNIALQSGGQGVTVMDTNALANAAYLFGVPDADMTKKMTERTVRIRGQAPIDVPMKLAEAVDARDACAKFVYTKLFDFLVSKINNEMTLNEPKFKSIGILDIFGFEIFEINSFEQMCINYTNEKLQQHFNTHTFKNEEQTYKEERIKYVHVEFIDNQPILDLIEQKPYGILNLCDEEVRIPEGSDKGFLSKIVESQRANQYFFTDVQYGIQSFMLIHYAGTVAYDTTGFLEKNRDTLTQDLQDMVTGSSNVFLSSLFGKEVQQQSARKRKATLGNQFKTQLNSLMKTLNETAPHYIRCVKPNDDKAPLYFVARNCHEQLRYSGVFEAVQIRKSGFPFRLKHGDFVERYACVLGQQCPKNVRGCEMVLGHFGFPPENIQMGVSKVFYRAEEHRKLELDRSIVLEQQNLENWLQEMISKDPNSMEDPEPYYAELSQAVRRANQFKLESQSAYTARQMLEAFIEARIDPETKATMQAAFDSRDEQQLREACELADYYGYRTRLCRDCKMMSIHIIRINEEVIKARETLEDKPMEVCLQSADKVGCSSDDIEYFRWMFTLSGEKYLQEQMRAAVALKDDNRQIRLSIKLKEIVFKSSEHMFVLKNFTKLKEGSYWASEKIMKLSAEKLRLGMMKWTKESVHASLTEVPTKEAKKESIRIFKNIQIYMGDRKTKNANLKPQQIAIDVATTGLKSPILRDEIFCQIIKQIQSNPSGTSAQKAWDLMILCLNCFPPDHDFENYLEVFLKNNASPADRYILALHTIIYSKARKYGAPTPTEYDQIISGKNIHHPEFSDMAPPGAPSWQDLLMDWTERDDDDDMTFNAEKHDRGAGPVIAYSPKNTTGAPAGAKPPPKKKPEPAQPAYQGAWIELIDPDSGYPYYENTETNESSWDKPAEMP